MTLATSDSIDQLPSVQPEEAPAPVKPLRPEGHTEPGWKRQLFLVLALILTAVFALMFMRTVSSR